MCLSPQQLRVPCEFLQPWKALQLCQRHPLSGRQIGQDVLTIFNYFQQLPAFNSHPQFDTRIIIYNGHREIGLVLAGHYFQKENLVLAFKSESNGDTSLDSLLFHSKCTGQVAVLPVIRWSLYTIMRVHNSTININSSLQSTQTITIIPRTKS